MSQAKMTRLIFTTYIFFLIWCILLKFNLPFRLLFFQNYRYINWIPYAAPLTLNGQVVPLEMLFNLVVFLPLGAYLKLMKPNWSHLKIVCSGFLISLLFELLQYVLAIGMTDVTDVIHNTLGSYLGIWIYQAFVLAFKSKAEQVLNSLGILLAIIAFIVFMVFGFNGY
ncbi:VanZ family protein [Streptococcus ictaluri]|uniref:VanZ-like protein n=1 Tax=Streptococcus ictaluri 707-05 TaxID=764299 RepID=G5K1C9_9STRE|nr:VanZ family protein [Streptococcus ictaluri]EHI70252.1 VanZ-like protein [Streptococcus ictaluri 707-05]